MRTSLTIDDAVMKKIMEVASLQNRSIAGQMRHMIMTHPEMHSYQYDSRDPVHAGPVSYRPKPEWGSFSGE